MTQENLGLVDQMQTKHITNAFDRAEYETSRPAVEAGQPSIKPEPYFPDSVMENAPSAYEEAVDNYDIHTNTYSPSNVETWEEFETRIQKQQVQTIRTGQTRYNSPPVTSGAPSISDGKRPSQEEVIELQRKESIEYLNKQLMTLQMEQSQLQLKLNRNKQNQKSIQDKLNTLS